MPKLLPSDRSFAKLIFVEPKFGEFSIQVGFLFWNFSPAEFLADMIVSTIIPITGYVPHNSIFTKSKKNYFRTEFQTNSLFTIKRFVKINLQKFLCHRT